ncbi:hydroxyisourate hydrolase [Defluviimonas aestuarii]|uniref:hydroxyisourate hydrolase n=1 Tax=Albidovulum aestuarii TaxID=1130726 RepID=UPI00249B3A22|nr:hydroxyisourate hydrolase [Defluviimonas aestuarii]MDI3338774.1 hydroxyisourate hydrolase [Defluviimonas aestuarii]
MTATISTHVLNGADGTHSSGVAVRLINLTTGATLFEEKTDSGGRLSHQVDLTGLNSMDRYELSFATRAGAMEEIALRFVMPDPEGRYHMPVILSPNAASFWWSVPE